MMNLRRCKRCSPGELLYRGLNYLATPYTNYQPSRDEAFIAATKLGGQLARTGLKLICPVTQGHMLAVLGKIDQCDQAFWKNFNYPLMAASDNVIVGKLAGWEESSGVLGELEYFKSAGKPIFFCDPPTLEIIPWTAIERPFRGQGNG
jgi:hypothetical protein